jgi:hypothetical protein
VVEPVLAAKWTPLGVLQRLRNLVRQPGDVVLALRIAQFLWSVPGNLDQTNLPSFLSRVRGAPRPPAPDVRAGVERIMRLRQPWLRLSAFGNRNTCYIRALTLYRFLDAGQAPMHIHFGVERGAIPDSKLGGHAWITVGGEIFEAPDPVVQGRVREIYSHPPA